MNELKSPIDAAESVVSDQERLGIRHLMYWMVGFALAMGVLQVRDRLNEQTVSGNALIGQVAFAGAYGLGLAGLMTCLRRLRLKQVLMRHPGYGWLFLLGLAAAIDLGTNPSVLWIYSAFFPGASGSIDYSAWYLDLSRVVFGWLIGAVVAVVLSWRCKDGFLWRISFVAMGLYATRVVVFNCFQAIVFTNGLSPDDWATQVYFFLEKNSVHLTLISFTMAVLLAAIANDLIRRRTRDWLHWCGVIPWLVLSGLIGYGLAT